MRHDPASAAIVIMLRSLKMHGMSQAVTDLIEQGAPAFDASVPILSQLLKAELAEREVRSIAYHMKSARFPAYKDISGFDFATSEINEATVRTLHRCEFMDGARNVVLIGGPGTGKNPRCNGHRSSSHRTSSSQSPLLLDHRTGQRPRTGKGQGQGRPDCRGYDQARPPSSGN